jgi:hypothetical protein
MPDCARADAVAIAPCGRALFLAFSAVIGRWL